MLGSGPSLGRCLRRRECRGGCLGGNQGPGHVLFPHLGVARPFGHLDEALDAAEQGGNPAVLAIAVGQSSKARTNCRHLWW